MSCRCGCGGDTKAGDFVPGHDQKLRARLEKEVGGILAMEDLVTTAKRYAIGDLPEAELGREVRRVFKTRDER
ncbi:MAG: hypothetical protein H0X66_15045 [Verrucomicrobia bacterium]|nr:hypothetical protein [Verrucomicrobiota bacterium]